MGDREAYLQRAVVALDRIGEVQRVSSFYETLPWGNTEQPPFVNAVVQMGTTLTPEALLAELHSIEQQMGRERTLPWGPRTLDLDLLAIAHLTIETDTLKLPHPGIAQRLFVLIPWLEIAPQYHVPGLGTVEQLATTLMKQTPPGLWPEMMAYHIA